MKRIAFLWLMIVSLCLTGRYGVGSPSFAPKKNATKIVESARLEVRRQVRYDASYNVIAYPGGDVPQDVGACTDVTVRALRAIGRDLQVLIHHDKASHPGRYRRYPGQSGTDTNIDHRRVPNQIAFFRGHAVSLPTVISGPSLTTWQAGDLVYVKLPSGLDHCGVISDRRGPSGRPLVIHNLSVAAEEDVLGSWKIVAHFRYPRQK